MKEPGATEHHHLLSKALHACGEAARKLCAGG